MIKVCTKQPPTLEFLRLFFEVLTMDDEVCISYDKSIYRGFIHILKVEYIWKTSWSLGKVLYIAVCHISKSLILISNALLRTVMSGLERYFSIPSVIHTHTISCFFFSKHENHKSCSRASPRSSVHDGFILIYLTFILQP